MWGHPVPPRCLWYPSKASSLFCFFALLACQTALWNPNSCLMVLMHHLNADPSVKRGWGWVVACGEGIHRIWKSDDGGCAQNADAILEWNIKPLESLSGDFGARVPFKRVQWINKYLKQKLGEYWADELFIWGGETTGVFIFFEDEELDPHTETQHHQTSLEKETTRSDLNMFNLFRIENCQF